MKKILSFRAAKLAFLAAGVAVAGTWAGALAATGPAEPAHQPDAQASDKKAGSPLQHGVGSFIFTGWAGKPLRVFYFIPDKVTTNTRILFVIHGQGRNASGYRDAWVPAATAGQYIVLTPEYSEKDFPTSLSYNIGHIVDKNGKPRPPEKWSFASIEPLFDTMRQATGTRVPTYAIYGHSAGGQFLHRFLMLMPKARYSRVIAANAGWYTLPDLDKQFPYGLKGAPIDEKGLAAALGKPLTILLGTEDTDPNHEQLSKTPEAMEQGPQRVARGEYFYARGKEAAAKLGVPFAWKIAYAPGVAHSNKGMSQAAASLVWE